MNVTPTTTLDLFRVFRGRGDTAQLLHVQRCTVSEGRSLCNETATVTYCLDGATYGYCNEHIREASAHARSNGFSSQV